MGIITGKGYVGTLYTEDGLTEPGSRDTEYFATHEAAAQALKDIEAGKRGTRLTP